MIVKSYNNLVNFFCCQSRDTLPKSIEFVTKSRSNKPTKPLKRTKKCKQHKTNKIFYVRKKR